MPELSIIILNWNGRHFLDDCLSSIAKQSFRDFEVVLIDNGSVDGSAKYLREFFPWVQLLELPVNKGFAEGNNLGFEKCRGKYIVTLNNDTKLEPEFLAELVKKVESDLQIGMVAAKMLNFYITDRIDSIGIKATTAGFGANIGVGETDNGDYDLSVPVFGASAGAALYRRSMLEETGFFDVDFFAYYEDLDLAWRGQLAGWRSVTAPAAIAYHIHSATSGRMSHFTVYHLHRNKWYTIIKNWPAALLIKYIIPVIFYDLAALWLAVLKKRGGSALLARLHLLRDLPLFIKKRSAVKKLCRISLAERTALLEPGSSVWKILRRKLTGGV